MILDPKLKEELNNLEKDYNIVPEDSNIDYLASRRVEITKFWIPRLLRMSMILNIITLVFLILAVTFLLNKPEPRYFGTTPNGKVIPLETVNLKVTEQGIVAERKWEIFLKY